MNWYKIAQEMRDEEARDAFLASVKKNLPSGGSIQFEEYGGPRYLELSDITATAPGKGWGSIAMQIIVDNASYYGIELMVLPVGEPGSEKHERLADFYNRYGFEDEGGGSYHRHIFK